MTDRRYSTPPALGQKARCPESNSYVVGAENWPLFNQALAEAFGDHGPARSVVLVPELHHGYLIEIDGMELDAAAS